MSASRRTKLLSVAVVGLAAAGLVTGIIRYWPGNAPLNAGDVAASADIPAAMESPSPVSLPRPDFSLPDVSGAQRAVGEWNGKVVALNFWATWCGPCKEEIPLFNTLQQHYGPQGMQFIGVAMDNRASVQDYLKVQAIDYPVLVDGEDAAADLAIRYGDDQGVVPYTAFIDRRGRIAFVQFGAMSEDLARQVIESLL